MGNSCSDPTHIDLASGPGPPQILHKNSKLSSIDLEKFYRKARVPAMPSLQKYDKDPFSLMSDNQTCYTLSDAVPPRELPNKIEIFYYDEMPSKENRQIKMMKIYECYHQKLCNLRLWYSNGNLCFDGKAILAAEKQDIIRGSLYYQNGQLFYSGGFDKKWPCDVDCILYYENGKIRYQGPIGKSGEVPKPKLASAWHIPVASFDISKFLDCENSMEGFNAENGIEISIGDDLFWYSGGLIDGKKFGAGLLLYRATNVHMYEGNFVNDRPDGPHCVIRNSDNETVFQGKMIEGVYIEGALNYSQGGKLKYDGKFIDGKPSGKNVTIWNRNGTKKFVGEVQAGSYVYGRIFNHSGHIAYEGYFKGNKPHGELVRNFFSNGKVRFEGTMKKGVRVYGRLYAETGLRLYEGFFKNGKPHGRQIKLYSEKGNLVYVGSMKEGRKDGPGVFYSENGKLQGRGIWNGDDVNLAKGYGINFYANGQINGIGFNSEDMIDPEMPKWKQGHLRFSYYGKENFFNMDQRLEGCNAKLSGNYLKSCYEWEFAERTIADPMPNGGGARNGSSGWDLSGTGGNGTKRTMISSIPPLGSNTSNFSV
jgi:antitoxin component YwqK of YwqJK toxin-antitoxin module